MDSFRVACEAIVDNTKFAMGKVVHEMQAIGAGATLVLLPLRQRCLEIGNGVIPKFPVGVRDAPLVVIPPAPAPELARRHAVLLPLLDINLATFNRAPH